MTKTSTPVVVGIDHVQIAVPEGGEQRCRSFYLDVLGLREVGRPAAAGRSFLWVAVGAQQIHFRVDRQFRPAPLAHPALLARDLDGIEDRLAQGGYEISRAGSIDAGRFHVRDPFGNRLEFVEVAK